MCQQHIGYVGIPSGGALACDCPLPLLVYGAPAGAIDWFVLLESTCADGAKLYGTSQGRVDSCHNRVTFTIDGGTGRFSGATGSGKYTGTFHNDTPTGNSERTMTLPTPVLTATIPALSICQRSTEGVTLSWDASAKSTALRSVSTQRGFPRLAPMGRSKYGPPLVRNSSPCRAPKEAKWKRDR